MVNSPFFKKRRHKYLQELGSYCKAYEKFKKCGFMPVAYLDNISRSDTVSAMDIRTRDADVGHEASIGRISDDSIFYLMSRGLSEEDAKALIVSGLPTMFPRSCRLNMQLR